MKTPLKEIESDCAELAGARANLRKAFEAKQRIVSEVSQMHDPGIDRLREKCVAIRASLHAQIENNRSEFKSPKTREFFGITVGFEKERDSMEYPSDEILVQRCEEMLTPAQQKTVLQKTTTVLRTPLKQLGLQVLQKLGIRKVNGADKAVIRASDDDIETLVDKVRGKAAISMEKKVQ